MKTAGWQSQDLSADARRRGDLFDGNTRSLARSPLTARSSASSGVRVELILPARGDSYIVQHASLSYLKPLLERGIYVYLYQHGFMHAKTVCIDGKLAFIGTVNLDTRSFYINFEISAVIQDEGLCRQLDEQFDTDLRQSRLLTLDDWTNRPSLHRGT